MSYRAKLLIGVCGLVVLAGAAVTWLAYRSARASTETLARSLFREVSGHAVTHTQGFVLRAAPIAESLKQLADNGLQLDDSDRLAPQLLAFLKANAGLSWISYGDRSGTFTGAYRPLGGGLRINQSRIVAGHTHLVEHDVLPDGTWRLGRKDDDSGYDPRRRPYYQKAEQAGRLVWLPPYVFYDQGIPGISCAVPVYDKAGGLRGVLSVDFDLNALSDFVAGLSVSERGRVFLFTSDQVLLADPAHRPSEKTGQHGTGKLLMLSDTQDGLVDAFRRDLRAADFEAAKRISQNPSPKGSGGGSFHFFTFRHAGADYFGSTTAFRVGDDQVWVVGAVAPQSDFLAGVWQSQRLSLAVAAAAVLVAALLAIAMARRISGPVLSLVRFMQRVGEGDLEARADFRGGREFRQLSEALNRMIVDLRDRLRLRHSLDVAMEVQQRLLPQHPPHVPQLDVAGHSTYCDETGGDYYDFLIVDEAAPDTLLIALGDVMGHGVAAALVMAGARAVLRDRATTSGSLAELMGRLNRLLCADLEGTRFMTMHLSIFSGRDRTVRWASAGHDPAILFDPAADRFEEVEAGNLPLGIVEETEYAEQTCGPLRRGQVMFIGTDGVWECPNEQGEPFGKERLHAALRESAGGTAAEIVAKVVGRVAAFRGPARQVDDVTFVIVKVLSDEPPPGA